MKTTIITGANSGIGKKTFLKFLREGHRVILGCRREDSTRSAIDEVTREVPNANERITFIPLDLESFASVKKFAIEVQSKFTQIDCIIHNAGAFNHGIKSFQKTQDGYELTYQVNVFSPYLLNQLLYPLLTKSTKPQIIYASTTNIKYFFDPKREVNLEDTIPHNRTYNSYKMYGDSKICQLAMMFHESAKNPEIQMNAVMIPAVKIDPKSRRKLTPAFRILAILQAPFSIPQEIIADCYYFLSQSNLYRTIINSKLEIMKPAPYATSLSENFTNLFTDRQYPDYCHRTEIQMELEKILTSIAKNNTISIATE